MHSINKKYNKIAYKIWSSTKIRYLHLMPGSPNVTLQSSTKLSKIKEKRSLKSYVDFHLAAALLFYTILKHPRLFSWAVNSQQDPHICLDVLIGSDATRGPQTLLLPVFQSISLYVFINAGPLFSENYLLLHPFRQVGPVAMLFIDQTSEHASFSLVVSLYGPHLTGLN